MLSESTEMSGLGRNILVDTSSFHSGPECPHIQMVWCLEVSRVSPRCQFLHRGATRLPFCHLPQPSMEDRTCSLFCSHLLDNQETRSWGPVSKQVWTFSFPTDSTGGHFCGGGAGKCLSWLLPLKQQKKYSLPATPHPPPPPCIAFRRSLGLRL